MADRWCEDASTPVDYHAVRIESGREFVFRLTTGADVWRGIQQFAVDHGVRFARIGGAFMGGLQPARFLVWAPHPEDPGIWHHEEPRQIDELSMILAMGGMIHPRIAGEAEEPFPAVHFVAGGSWNVPSFGGHLLPGSRVKGSFEFFITELSGIDVIPGPPDMHNFPENWYRETKPFG